MLPRALQGSWEKVRQELRNHDKELGGHEVTFIVNDIEGERRRVPGKKPESIYDLMKDHIGRFNFGNANLSENTSEKFIEILEEKRQQGHL